MRCLISALLFLPSFVMAKANYNPGIDISWDSLQAQVDSQGYLCDNNATCSQFDEAMAQSDLNFGIFVERPFAPQYKWGILAANFGLGFSLRHFVLTNDPNQNDDLVTTTDADGVTTTNRPFRIDLDMYSLNPYGYGKFGIVAPYLPWIFLTTGLGYQYVQGQLFVDIDNKTRDLAGHDISMEVKIEVVLLRTKYLWLTTYLALLPNARPIQMENSADDADDFGIRFWASGLGARIHVLAF